MELIAGIMLDVFFFARFIYIKTQFYKTKGIANGNANQYSSEFIYGNKGYNYVCSVKKNIFSMYHERGSVYTICVKKDNPYNGVMGNECIFRKNRALAPHERSAVPLGTDHCPVG